MNSDKQVGRASWTTVLIVSAIGIWLIEKLHASFWTKFAILMAAATVFDFLDRRWQKIRNKRKCQSTSLTLLQ